MKRIFDSFIMAGYECNAALDLNKRFSDLKDTKHDLYCRADYMLLKDLGIKTVREGLLWSTIDKGNARYDFSLFEKMMQIAKEENIQQIWDLNHFDYPSYLDPLSDGFVSAFTSYAVHAVKTIRKYDKRTIFIVPFNEISFFSFMGGTAGGWAPFKTDKGYELKLQAIKCVISAINAIRKIDSDIRFINVDPFMIRRPINPNNIIGESNSYTFEEITFEALDMIGGLKNPELGGSLSHLDIIGINHYPTSQEWIYYDENFNVSSQERIDFKDPQWTPLSKMLTSVYARYKLPILVSETGAWGDLRPDWWKLVLEQISESLKIGLDIQGVCAYPAIDRHDWSKGHLTNSGLWDFKENDDSRQRIPHDPTISIIKNYAHKLS